MFGRPPARRILHRSGYGDFLSRLLDPIDMLAEAIFSILIMLSFTMAYRIFLFQENDGFTLAAAQVNELLLAALGATLAWGTIDGVMYMLLEVLQRSEQHKLLYQLQAAQDEQEALALVADEFDYILAPITSDTQRENLYRDVYAHLRESQPQPAGITSADLQGAIASVVVAMLTVAPSLTPLLLLQEHYRVAIWLSNVISFGMLFGAGYQWGRYTGTNPIRIGLLLVSLGVVMVVIALLLGG